MVAVTKLADSEKAEFDRVQLKRVKLSSSHTEAEHRKRVLKVTPQPYITFSLISQLKLNP